MRPCINPIVLGLAGFFGIASTASAVVGVPDEVPAGTLLVPYFGVSLSCDPSAANTLVDIENTTSDPTLVHITLWTDLSFPSIDFDLYLPANTTDTFDLAAAFCNGTLPSRVADLGLFPSCAGFFPFPDPAITGALLDRLRTYHTGQQSLSDGQCHGVDYGDQIARGYVTIDDVAQCSTLFPSQTTYYDGGVLSFENPLRGSFRVLDPTTGFDEVFMAVHLEADSTVLGPGDSTFYGRYLPAGSSDSREPLPSTVTAPYRFTPAGDTKLFLWREGGVFSGSDGFACGPPPALPPPLPDGTFLVEPLGGPDQMGALVAPYELNWFDFGSLGADPGNNGSSSGQMTATLASQSWLLAALPSPTPSPTSQPATPNPSPTSAIGGAPCTAPGQCQSGYCVDGVCCDQPCTDPGEACNTAGNAGTCQPVAQGVPGAGRGTLLVAFLTIAGLALWRLRHGHER